MKSQLKSKIIMVGIVALFAFITTIGATYAWFTIGDATNIQSIELTVTSSTSLLIRMDDPSKTYAQNLADSQNPSNYVSTLDTDTILGAYRYDRIRFRPVTTTDGVLITYQDPAATLPSSSDTTIGAGQYMDFKVWVLSQSATVDVALQDYTITATNTNTHKNDVVNALRVSFTTGSTTLIYGLNKDYDFVFNQYDAGYDSTPLSTKNAIDNDVLDDLTELHGVYYISSGTEVVGESTTDMDSVDNPADVIFRLTADVPTQVTIRIWIEGWDSNTDNNIISANFALSFIFAVKAIIV